MKILQSLVFLTLLVFIVGCNSGSSGSSRVTPIDPSNPNSLYGTYDIVSVTSNVITVSKPAFQGTIVISSKTQKIYIELKAGNDVKRDIYLLGGSSSDPSLTSGVDITISGNTITATIAREGSMTIVKVSDSMVSPFDDSTVTPKIFNEELSNTYEDIYLFQESILEDLEELKNIIKGGLQELSNFLP